MQFGLLGEKLDYSFSKNYFEKKFRSLNLDHSYINLEIDSIDEFPQLLENNPELKGLNVTIPFKESVLSYLDELDVEAKIIGAVNTIQFKNGILKGYNSDVFGFEESIKPLLSNSATKALILGTGGASKAVAYVFGKLGLDCKKVSRSPKSGEMNYKEASFELDKFQVVVNTTPLGTFPDTQNQPPLSLERVHSQQVYFDLIYNPLESVFLKEAKSKGAITKNGLEMLELQANKSWDIWNEF